MSKRQILIVLGIWNMLFLFLGFPAALDKVLALASGAIIVIVAFALKQKDRPSQKKDVPYVENKVSQVEEFASHI